MTVNVPVGVLDSVNNILSIVEYPNNRMIDKICDKSKDAKNFQNSWGT